MEPQTARKAYWNLAIARAILLILIASLLAFSRILPSLSIVGTPVCAFRHLTGIPCPFCFMTKSWMAASTGDFSTALFLSPLGTLLFFAAIMAVLWLVSALLFRLAPLPVVEWARKRPVWISAIALVLANWVYNIYRAMI